jgi:hypothetical protein
LRNCITASANWGTQTSRGGGTWDSSTMRIARLSREGDS